MWNFATAPRPGRACRSRRCSRREGERAASLNLPPEGEFDCVERKRNANKVNREASFDFASPYARRPFSFVLSFMKLINADLSSGWSSLVPVVRKHTGQHG